MCVIDFAAHLLWPHNMRTLRLAFAIIFTLFTLTACGYRTPLALPKPVAKPPAAVPAPTLTPTDETK